VRRIGLVVVLALSLNPSLAPLVAGAQPAGKTQRIGYLALGAAVPPGIFVERLREAGYVEGRNANIDYRLARASTT